MKHGLRLTTATATLAALSIVISAAQAGQKEMKEVAPLLPADSWEFKLALPSWLAATSGTVGVGSELTWQVYGALGCQISRHVYAEAGYRYLYTDYHRNGFIYGPSPAPRSPSASMSESAVAGPELRVISGCCRDRSGP